MSRDAQVAREHAMDKRFWVCGLVMSTVALLLGFIVHGLLLAPDYAALGAMFRNDDDTRHYAPWMVMAPLLTGFAMPLKHPPGVVDWRPSLLPWAPLLLDEGGF